MEVFDALGGFHEQDAEGFRCRWLERPEGLEVSGADMEVSDAGALPCSAEAPHATLTHEQD